jgi:hypothetical protein
LKKAVSIEGGGGEDAPMLIPCTGEFNGVGGRFAEESDGGGTCALELPLLLLVAAERLNHALVNMLGASVPVVVATGELLD